METRVHVSKSEGKKVFMHVCMCTNTANFWREKKSANHWAVTIFVVWNELLSIHEYVFKIAFILFRMSTDRAAKHISIIIILKILHTSIRRHMLKWEISNCLPAVDSSSLSEWHWCWYIRGIKCIIKSFIIVIIGFLYALVSLITC